MKKWSEEAWEAARPVYDSILKLPFLEQLAEGTLPREKFEYYLRQDALYLDNYSKVLAHIGSRLTDRAASADFFRFALDGVAVEEAMHEVFLGGMHPSESEMSPACMLYTSIHAAQATAPVEVEAAAVLPCFWVYREVGVNIIGHARLEGNPYSQWIETYADENFEKSTRRAIGICDSLAEKAGEDVRRRMTDLFVLCTRMEWLFWDSAFNLEKWKI